MHRKELKLFLLIVFLCSSVLLSMAQVFVRSELNTPLLTPWEITYGPDHFLWLTESQGRVARVDPIDGSKILVYWANDFYSGSPLEKHPLCFNPGIGNGTLGLALHPDFLDPATAYIYYVYSYNSGSDSMPTTHFKIKRLKWDTNSETVVEETDLITHISNGHDHLGGRLMAIKQGDKSYLFLSIGDHGISETNSPDCYSPPSDNPNFLAQDPNFPNGKIHRFNIDGSIPTDNPITGNSFYTRGHRNPQGLMYNSDLDILYDIEHGDRTDDEINILHKGMNYGWKFVRGYHGDSNIPGEDAFINNYIPYPGIENDSLVPAFYSFCATEMDTSSKFTDWCTIAPSDGIYYGSKGIPEWTNSLLLVSLKNGLTTDMELHCIKLEANGQITASTPGNPNPKTFFGQDQLMNGRLRDICVSEDGKKIFLINNFGTDRDKITVYTYDSIASKTKTIYSDIQIQLYPNPTNDLIHLNLLNHQNLEIISIKVYDILAKQVLTIQDDFHTIPVGSLKKGTYTLKVNTNKGNLAAKFLKI